MKHLFVIPLCIALAACGAKPHDAKTAVYQVVVEYDLAVHIADAYKNLPPCGTGVVVCSDAAIVAKLQQAYRDSSPAIAAAEAAVRDPNFDTSTANAVLVSANAALAALTAITNTLKVKP